MKDERGHRMSPGHVPFRWQTGAIEVNIINDIDDITHIHVKGCMVEIFLIQTQKIEVQKRYDIPGDILSYIYNLS